MAGDLIATIGSNPVFPASEADNFFSGRPAIADKAQFAGVFVPKTTTMRRTNRDLFRPIRRLSVPILRAMIVEWWFPMHVDEMLARLQRKVLLHLSQNRRHFVAPQRPATLNSNLEW